MQVTETQRYYIKVPQLKAHTNHPNGKVCGIGRKVDPSILERIHELVGAGKCDLQMFRIKV